MSWITEAQDVIYTTVKVRSQANLIADYPQLRYTQDDSAQIEAQFPTVYVQYLAGRELARDLEGDEVHAFQSDVEVHVTVSKAQGKRVAFRVANAVADEFKKFRYAYRMIPIMVSTGNDTKEVTFRMTRVLAEDDEI